MKMKNVMKKTIIIVFALLVFLGGLTVMPFAPGAGTVHAVYEEWIELGSEIYSGHAKASSFYMLGDVPYVAYIADAGGGHDKVTVKRYDAVSGVWHLVGVPAFSPAENSYGLSLYVAEDGTPYVAFSDVENGYKISVMKFDGVHWTYVGSPGFSENIIQEVSLHGDENGLYVGYLEEQPWGPSTGHKPVFKKFVDALGSDWETIKDDIPVNGSSGNIHVRASNGAVFVLYPYNNQAVAAVMTTTGTGRSWAMPSVHRQESNRRCSWMEILRMFPW